MPARKREPGRKGARTRESGHDARDHRAVDHGIGGAGMLVVQTGLEPNRPIDRNPPPRPRRWQNQKKPRSCPRSVEGAVHRLDEMSPRFAQIASVCVPPPAPSSNRRGRPTSRRARAFEELQYDAIRSNRRICGSQDRGEEGRKIQPIRDRRHDGAAPVKTRPAYPPWTSPFERMPDFVLRLGFGEVRGDQVLGGGSAAHVLIRNRAAITRSAARSIHSRRTIRCTAGWVRVPVIATATISPARVPRFRPPSGAQDRGEAARSSNSAASSGENDKAEMVAVVPSNRAAKPDLEGCRSRHRRAGPSPRPG